MTQDEHNLKQDAQDKGHYRRDLADTIQFTEDELKRIRNFYNQRLYEARPEESHLNAQGYDEDFFDRQAREQEEGSREQDFSRGLEADEDALASAQTSEGDVEYDDYEFAKAYYEGPDFEENEERPAELGQPVHQDKSLPQRWHDFLNQFKAKQATSETEMNLNPAEVDDDYEDFETLYNQVEEEDDYFSPNDQASSPKIGDLVGSFRAKSASFFDRLTNSDKTEENEGEAIEADSLDDMDLADAKKLEAQPIEADEALVYEDERVASSEESEAQLDHNLEVEAQTKPSITEEADLVDADLVDIDEDEAFNQANRDFEEEWAQAAAKEAQTKQQSELDQEMAALHNTHEIILDNTLEQVGVIDAVIKAEEEQAEADYLAENEITPDLDVEDEETLEPESHFESEVMDEDLNHITESADQARSDHFVSGTIWMTVGSIFSRILGAIYIIPWAAWLGAEYTQANSLYSVGYKPYSLFLALATAGFPSAIAKLMAYFHSKKEYGVAQKLFRYAMVIMLVTGIVSGGLLFALAPALAEQSPTINPEGATLVIRSLVPALLILPIMSLLRGYFQGFNDMKPTAVSQIIEQIARVIYMLALTYAIMKIYSGDVTQAVVHSTFAAFIGALLSLVYLIYLLWRQQKTITSLVQASPNKVSIDFKESFKLLIRDSIPFVLLGSGIIIAQLIDTYSFSQIMQATSPLLLIEISELYGTLSLDVDKLMMIIISLAVAMAASAIPSVTSLFAKKDVRATSDLVQRILVIFMFIMLPASFGMVAISDNIYHLFYANGAPAGPGLLITGSLSSIFLGAYTVLSTILQSMDQRRMAIRYLLIGLLVKAMAQYPFVAVFQAHGALAATLFAFLVASLLMCFELHRHLEFDFAKLISDLTAIIIVSGVMLLITGAWNIALNRLFGTVGRGLTFVKVLFDMVIAVFVYGAGMGLMGKLHILLGHRFQEIQDKLRIFPS